MTPKYSALLLERIENEPESLAEMMINTVTYKALSEVDRASLLGEVLFFSYLYASDEASERLTQAISDRVTPEQESLIAGDLRERVHWMESSDQG